MREVYRKRGSVLRYEHGFFVRASESGEAIEENGRFECRPWRDVRPLDAIDDAAVRQTVERIRSTIRGDVGIERLIVTDGVAEHEMEDRRWSDRTRRVHLSIVCRGHRLLIDEAGFDFDLAEIVDAFAKIGTERPAPHRLRLEPRVIAALTPLFAHDQVSGGVDGKGFPIEGNASWYRPSYRVRPLRTAMNVIARCPVGEIDGDRAAAVAALSDGRLLCVDGGQAFPVKVEVSRLELMSKDRRWFPIAAGVWAGEGVVSGSRER